MVKDEFKEPEARSALIDEVYKTYAESLGLTSELTDEQKLEAFERAIAILESFPKPTESPIVNKEAQEKPKGYVARIGPCTCEMCKGDHIRGE